MSNLKDVFKKRKEQHESIQLRHDIINAVKRQNYINEYDRINGYLSHKGFSNTKGSNSSDL